jgi:hypothetical protein
MLDLFIRFMSQNSQSFSGCLSHACLERPPRCGRLDHLVDATNTIGHRPLVNHHKYMPKVRVLADLKVQLDEEKATRVATQVEADVLSQAVRDLKISGDRFATQIPTLQGKIKQVEDKVVEGLNEVRARELCLERTTGANDDYQKEVAQLTKKLECKSPE